MNNKNHGIYGLYGSCPQVISMDSHNDTINKENRKIRTIRSLIQ